MDLADDSVAILKYKLNGKYQYSVMDKFDEEDEAKRLDKMIQHSAILNGLYGDDYEELWIKICPIFATK